MTLHPITKSDYLRAIERHRIQPYSDTLEDKRFHETVRKALWLAVIRCEEEQTEIKRKEQNTR